MDVLHLHKVLRATTLFCHLVFENIENVVSDKTLHGISMDGDINDRTRYIRIVRVYVGDNKKEFRHPLFFVDIQSGSIHLAKSWIEPHWCRYGNVFKMNEDEALEILQSAFPDGVYTRPQ